MSERVRPKFDLKAAVTNYYFPQGFSENSFDKACEDQLVTSEVAEVTALAEQPPEMLAKEAQDLVEILSLSGHSLSFQHLLTTKVVRNILAYQLVTNGETPYLWKKNSE